MLPHFASLLGPSSSSGSILDTLNFRVWLSSLHATSLLPADTPPCNDESVLRYYCISSPQHCSSVFCTFPTQSQKSMGYGDKKNCVEGNVGERRHHFLT